jgi:uncharacterized protein (DUF427 family)
MAHPEITRATETIHNPADARHFMRVKPVPRTVRVRRGGEVIAESRAAMRVTEVAKDVLDPVFYLPPGDISAELKPVEGRQTHCPLKGDASYFSLADGKPIAWSYAAAFDFADVITGLIAFYPDEVAVEEIGPDAA